MKTKIVLYQQNTKARLGLHFLLISKQLPRSLCTNLKMCHISVLKHLLKITSLIDIALFALSQDVYHATYISVSSNLHDSEWTKSLCVNMVLDFRVRWQQMQPQTLKPLFLLPPISICLIFSN